MQLILNLFELIICILLIALVLLQQGKGAEIGAAFGSGASNTIFGSSGASSFLFKLTLAVAALFFISSLGLGYYEANQSKKSHQTPLSAIAQQVEMNQTPPVSENNSNKLPEQNQTNSNHAGKK